MTMKVNPESTLPPLSNTLPVEKPKRLHFYDNPLNANCPCLAARKKEMAEYGFPYRTAYLMQTCCPGSDHNCNVEYSVWIPEDWVCPKALNPNLKSYKKR